MPAQATGEVVESFIRDQLIDLGVEEDTISADARFTDLDIDSLDAADLLREVNRTYGVKIPRRELVDATLADLVTRIVAATNGGAS